MQKFSGVEDGLTRDDVPGETEDEREEDDDEKDDELRTTTDDGLETPGVGETDTLDMLTESEDTDTELRLLETLLLLTTWQHPRLTANSGRP